ncbi:MAG: hemolysin family protein [Elusimicrobia bacterium]|nr:hemolysin family protein [Elusimicrobiota bacterium]
MFALAEILLMVVLFLIAAFFSMLEAALVTLSRVKIKKYLVEYPKKANGFKVWLENPNKYLTTLLLGNDAVTIIGTAVATSLATAISRKYHISEAFLVAVTAIIVWAVFLVLGEIVPKVLGVRNSEKITLFFINSLYRFDKFISPVSKLFMWFASLVTGKSGKKEIPILTYDDIKTTISVGHEMGVFGIETKQMMHSVLNFSQITAKSIMTPREKMTIVNIDLDKETFIDLVVESGHSRVPIYQGNADNIIGVIYAWDLMDMWRSGTVFTIDDLLRPIMFIEEERKVNELMRQFKKGESHLAIVKNSQSKIVGLITIEDIVEEVFGEILDEFDITELFRREEMSKMR